MGDGAVFIDGFSLAFEPLLVVAGTDCYVRVRRRGLLVLLLATNTHAGLLKQGHAELLFDQVLIPLAKHSSSHLAICQACERIAQSVASPCYSVPEGEALVSLAA